MSAPGVLRPPAAFAWYLPPLPLEQQRQRLHHPPERQILTQTPKQHNDATDTATTISIVSVSSSMSGSKAVNRTRGQTVCNQFSFSCLPAQQLWINAALRSCPSSGSKPSCT